LKVAWFTVAAAFAVSVSSAQEASYGIDVPVTLSGGILDTHRLQSEDAGQSPVSGGFRVMLYPTLKLGAHWFGYAAVQVRLTPYFYYDAFSPERELYTDTIQAYVGYQTRVRGTSLVVKAGQMVTAFGSFPLRYDDTQNPLLDQPLSYITELPLRSDQLVCNTKDLLWQYYGWVNFGCGGKVGPSGGLTPATLYGVPGIQVEASHGRFDGRLQIAGRSPAASDSWTTGTHYLQWAAGGGYTIRQGFRVGVSAFRGPYLSSAVAPLLPVGTTPRDFPASAIGFDGQWARGRWSVNAEWQRFQFDEPNFTQSPTAVAGYGEAKSVLTPRLYLAGRVGWLKTGGVQDASGRAAAQYAPTLTSVEMGPGFWIRRNLLFKASYGVLHMQGQSGSRSNVLGAQLVATFHGLNWGFR